MCEFWKAKIPGCLCASVSPDPDDPENYVHDLRIFSNHAAFEAHTDKSDQDMTLAMQEWFAKYDTTEPFTGALYCGASSDTTSEGFTKSSIKSCE